MDSEVVVGIDIGDHKVCALVGEVGAEGNLSVIGVGTTPAHGIKRGMVVSVDELAECVTTAVERAQRVSGYQIHRAEVSVSGSQVSSVNSRGVVAVSRATHEITDEDVSRAIDAARAIQVPPNREILHVIPRYFIVDGQEGVPDPVGMFGFRLEVEAHIVTAATTALQNLQRTLEKAKVQARDMVAAPLAAADAVLTPDEKDMGAIVADIGGGTTGVCVYADGAPFHTAILRVGGMYMTNDLTVGLRVPFNVAEDLKIRYGHALSSLVDPQEVIELPGGGRDTRSLSRVRACEIIEDRAAEIFAMILEQVKKSGHDGMLPGGVVLAGGTAELPGMADLGREIMGLPVRVATPQGVGGLVDSISSPAYASSVGLLHWSVGRPDEANSKGMFKGFKRPGNGSISAGMAGVLESLRRAFGSRE